MAAEPASMVARVTFMGEMSSIVDERNLQVTLPTDATVGDLLACLSKAYGDSFTHRVFTSPGKLFHTMLIFVDGEDIKERGGLAASLGSGEVDVIMMPMFGGG